ncbi:DUF6953 family protein [Paenibacillus cremeus]|uniref:Integron gene cassette protein n=1 Tax=Paenibacillus cremeus TaxID=2163881 RepID=A0A559KHX9_9BACL|nr:hypothetical protein [Paenibacillus cremeus]TVY11740.1 hypothetical protein FPZ49_00130 [Paenibacillus cremeus]
METTTAKAAEIAEWMVKEVKFRGILYQTEVIDHILANYGEAYIYVNENGNQSIDKEVKKRFKKLHGGKAAWDRDGFFWGWT